MTKKQKKEAARRRELKGELSFMLGALKWNDAKDVKIAVMICLALMALQELGKKKKKKR